MPIAVQRLFLAILLFSGSASGVIRRVPAEYATIRQGITAAQTGDTVLVAPGTYAENINFLGKNIVVASHFILDGDRSRIAATVINGGSPLHPDTASCVLIVSGEDTSALLEGFTLTGGRGTRWLDEHGAGVFREGGGILITLSSPTIRNNVIIDNEAVNSSGGVSAGGGAIRVGDGAPRILNNVIIKNRGMYGAGIVLNYCSGAIIRNNVVAQNRVYQAVPGIPTYGGGGIWILLRIPGLTTPNLIENNTIVANTSAGGGSGSAGRGGGIVFQNADVIAKNNIVWANRQEFGGQIHGAMPLTYSVVEGGYGGTGNTATDPLFADSALLLTPASPAVDTGDPAVPYQDPENPALPGTALWPSLGTLRNDPGAYGGPLRAPLVAPWSPGLFVPDTSADFGLVYPASPVIRRLPLRNTGSATLVLDSIALSVGGNGVTVTGPFPRPVGPGGADTLELTWLADSNIVLQDTLLLYHDDVAGSSPWRIPLSGSSVPTPRLSVNTLLFNFGNVDVNEPVRDTTFAVFNVGTAEDSVDVSLFYSNVQPPEAISVAPTSFRIAPGDSQVIQFTFYPPLVIRVGFGIYSPAVVVSSLRTPGAPEFQKTMRFRIIGTVDVQQEGTPASRLELFQNYPNPFNPVTTISFTVPPLRDRETTLCVYDLLGRKVATLLDGAPEAGVYSVEWDASGVGSGVYICRLQSGTLSYTRKMMVVR